MEAIARDYRSLIERTVEAQLYVELVEEYGFANAIARSLRDTFMRYFYTYLGHDRAEGQIIYSLSLTVRNKKCS